MCSPFSSAIFCRTGNSFFWNSSLQLALQLVQLRLRVLLKALELAGLSSRFPFRAARAPARSSRVPPVCSFCWFACSAFCRSAICACFCVVSACTFAAAALPSPDSWKIAWRLTNATLAPCGNGSGGEGGGCGGSSPAPARAWARAGPARLASAARGPGRLAARPGPGRKPSAALSEQGGRHGDSKTSHYAESFQRKQVMNYIKAGRAGKSSVALVRTSSRPRSGTGTPSAAAASIVQHALALRVVGENQPERHVQDRHEEPDFGAGRRLERACWVTSCVGTAGALGSVSPVWSHTDRTGAAWPRLTDRARSTSCVQPKASP